MLQKATSFIENQTEITDLYSELSYDELKSVLEGWLNPSGEGERRNCISVYFISK